MATSSTKKTKKKKGDVVASLLSLSPTEDDIEKVEKDFIAATDDEKLKVVPKLSWLGARLVVNLG